MFIARRNRFCGLSKIARTFNSGAVRCLEADCDSGTETSWDEVLCSEKGTTAFQAQQACEVQMGHLKFGGLWRGGSGSFGIMRAVSYVSDRE